MIVLQGGLVSGVNARRTSAPLQAAVLDLDVFDSEEEDCRITRVAHRQRPIAGHVGLHEVQSLTALQGSDAEAILLATQEES